MFHTLLIANRGEIACRIIRTARRLGVRTVAVYSEADARALHVAMADEAYRIGPPPAGESYLRGDAVLDVARRSGAQAIHPGYGFLSENAAFSEACAAAGVVFVGPPAAAIAAMGDKSRAKAMMAAAGVPVVPGYHGDDQSADRLAAEAERIGFPLLVKATAGGGGKGMRVVERPEDLPAALDGARREARAAFGDDRVLLERYLTRPRHVEVQVLADAAAVGGTGTCLYLFERDCSIQRRHQKVVEEAPGPGLGAPLRRSLGEAAVAAARAVDYVSAATCEFLLDEDGSFYFMEMNTRLQVEHAVTEMITGLDLVEWQLRVAAGESLPFRQDDLAINGHAIEVRLYAEDPSNQFLPATGRLRHLRLPGGSVSEGPHVRLDTGVREGDSVTIYYDPMIAKLIVWDRDRAAAVARLRIALGDCQILGVASNLDFLRAIAGHPAFCGPDGSADLDTRFIDRHGRDLLPKAAPVDGDGLAIGTLGVLVERRRQAAARAAASGDPNSPWHAANGWRLNDEAIEGIVFHEPGAGGPTADVEVLVRYRRDGRYRLELPMGAVEASGEATADGRLTADLDGVRRWATVVFNGLDLAVLTRGGTRQLTLVDPVAAADSEDIAGRLTAPMPGKIVAVLVQSGQRVTKGDPLAVLEAMKMEHTVLAPDDGTVTATPYEVGEQVEEGAELIRFSRA